MEFLARCSRRYAEEPQETVRAAPPQMKGIGRRANLSEFRFYIHPASLLHDCALGIGTVWTPDIIAGQLPNAIPQTVSFLFLT